MENVHIPAEKTLDKRLIVMLPDSRCLKEWASVLGNRVAPG